MNKNWLFISFLVIISGLLRAENNPYKINDSEIDLLFDQSSEIIISSVFAQDVFSLRPANQYNIAEEEKKIIAGI